MKYKRIFLIVMDSVGIGNDPEAVRFGDLGSNTLLHIAENVPSFNLPTLNKLGIYDLCNSDKFNNVKHNNSYTIRLYETSNGKDTMTGHWEMMGVYTKLPFKTFTDSGFPKELIDQLEKETGHKVIGNYAASGTKIIEDLGDEQIKNNALIVYTSADSVLQIAAHEEKTGLNELYRCCEIARKICMKPEWKVGRIIARPYLGNNSKEFYRTPNRHDLSLKPPYETDLNILKNNGFMTTCVGKINDIFDGFGVVETQKTISNIDGMNKTIQILKEKDFIGLCFVNLVEFDSSWGHRRNVQGYAKALEEFDIQLNEFIGNMKSDDLLLITADHGNDPTWNGTDHTRECVPLIAYSPSITDGKQLDDRNSFADIGSTILRNFNLNKNKDLIGLSIDEILK